MKKLTISSFALLVLGIAPVALAQTNINSGHWDIAAHEHEGSIELSLHNHDLAIAGRKLLCEALGTAPPAPESMLGSLASVLLPKADDQLPAGALDPLQAALWERHRIEVPVMRWPHPELRLLRISPQIYNSLEQYHYLAEAIQTLV